MESSNGHAEQGDRHAGKRGQVGGRAIGSEQGRHWREHSRGQGVVEQVAQSAEGKDASAQNEQGPSGQDPAPGGPGWSSRCGRVSGCGHEQ